jgi:phosphopantothenoylcysteine decarboxylase/phosphopantothenate--cysteine ligase
MGCAVAAAAVDAGHAVTLLVGPIATAPPAGLAELVRFETVGQLRDALDARFDACDALVMAAAVGDFRVIDPAPTKLRRAAGPVRIRLAPTEDLLAALGARRRTDQVLVGFAVEDVDADSKARAELERKNVDYVVVNPPAAMGADSSAAAIVTRDGFALDWAPRPKEQLAREIVKLLQR